MSFMKNRAAQPHMLETPKTGPKACVNAPNRYSLNSGLSLDSVVAYEER